MKITRFQDFPKFTRFGSYEVDYTPDSLIRQVTEWQEKEGLDTNPDFQRGHVWTEKQQVAYVEFFLRGGRTARVLYFNKPSWHSRAKTDYDDFVLVDGKQRLEAWRRFVGGEIVVFGSKFSEYTDSLRMNQTMRVHINDLQSKAEVLQWYLDFNSGGVVHSEEELAEVRRMLKAEGKKGRVSK